MAYLLDTHALIWFLEGNDTRLPQSIVSELINPDNSVFSSIVSFWEMAIKIQISNGQPFFVAGLGPAGPLSSNWDHHPARPNGYQLQSPAQTH